METQVPTPHPTLSLNGNRSDSTETLDETFEPHSLSPLKEVPGQPEDSGASDIPPRQDSRVAPVENADEDVEEEITETARPLRRSEFSASSGSLANVQGKLFEQLVEMADENKKLRNLLTEAQGKMEKQSAVAKEVVRSLQAKLARADEKSRLAMRNADPRLRMASSSEPAPAVLAKDPAMDTLRAQLAASEAKVAELTESLKTNECEAESFTTVASMLQRKITELAASLERSERTNGILKREVSIMQDGSEAVERDLEIERERSEELQQKLEEVVVLAKESMERCESLERELEVARTGENALEQLKAELVAVKEELELKSAEAKDFESKAAMLADRLLSAEVAKIQLGDEREKDTEVAQAAVAAAEGQLAQTKQMLEVARNALNKSQVDLTKATVELNIQQARITELEAEVVLLTEALRSSEAEKEALEVQASGDMATARAALAQGQDDLMNATRVMEEMLDAQSAGLAAKEEAIHQREAAAKQTEDAALAIRSSIADRTAELEAKLVESGRALSTTESRIEELKELHEQSITDKAELVASLHVILQQRDDQIAAIKDEVAGLHEAVALRVTELETNRLEFEAIVATKDAEMSRALEERAKVEELLRVAEVRFEALVAEEVRKFKELEAEAETSRVSAAEVATKLADAEKMVADGKRRNALVFDNMESELDIIRAEAMERTDVLETEIEELKLELVEKQAQMDVLVSSVDSRLNKVLASQRDPHRLLSSSAAGGHWAPDHLSPQCTSCAAPFNFAFRRHHCRACGQVFCADHASNFVELSLWSLSPAAGAPKARVCDGCHVELQ